MEPLQTEAPVTLVTPRLQGSFLSSYLVLMGYTTITLIEAIRTPSVAVRHIMNIETAVSFIAGLAYSMFNEKLKDPQFKLAEITPLRYMDWSITTPMLLLALLLFYNPSPDHPNIYHYLFILALNGGMLLSGYLGETGAIHKMAGGVGGFLFFGALLGFLYSCCIPKGGSLLVFGLFAAIWSFYGIAYYVEDEETKNIMYNSLDVVAKALFGISLWLYFGKVVSFKV